MARIIICAENYGGPGTGQFVHKLSVALSAKGHSVQGKTSLSMSAQDVAGLQADLIVGQHKGAGIGRAIADNAKIPFVLIMQGEKYVPSMKADLVVFSSKNYIDGYKASLGNTPAISIENGIGELCARISAMAEATAAENLKKSSEASVSKLASENAARSAAEAAATKSRIDAIEKEKQKAQQNALAHQYVMAQQRAATRENPVVHDHPFGVPSNPHILAHQQIIARQHALAQQQQQRVLQSSNPSVSAPKPAAKQSRLPAAKPSGEPIVSVIIVAQDDEATVGQTIKSVLEQKYKDVEIVFVDDGSSDGTSKIVSSITDPRLMVFRRPWKSGRHAARNLGFSQSSGEFLMFLDAGDVVTDDSIGALVSRIRAESNPGATIGRPMNITEQHRRWVFAAGGISDKDAANVADTIALYRRSAVEMAGKFKESVSIKEMDTDFVKRIVKASSIMFVDTPVGSRKHAAIATETGSSAANANSVPA